MPAHVITSEQQRDRMLHTPIPRLILSLSLIHISEPTRH